MSVECQYYQSKLTAWPSEELGMAAGRMVHGKKEWCTHTGSSWAEDGMGKPPCCRQGGKCPFGEK